MLEEQELHRQGEPCWSWLWPGIRDHGHFKTEQGCESSHCVSLMPSVYVCVKCVGKLNGGGLSYQLHEPLGSCVLLLHKDLIASGLQVAYRE